MKMPMHTKEMDKAMRKKKMPMSHMPKGATQSPKGDLGVRRQDESVKVGGFKAGSTIAASKRLK